MPFKNLSRLLKGAETPWILDEKRREEMKDKELCGGDWCFENATLNRRKERGGFWCGNILFPGVKKKKSFQGDLSTMSERAAFLLGDCSPSVFKYQICDFCISFLGSFRRGRR
ncbi:hypothetical protein PPERSA_06603 [Pseudocohnilembus persalinus]|uniref:Uncharacterized protein n=1 Tax=Pseudocohnilembus persalinus TaxID=266149 RepID=A0A0V0QRQ8_PSEPJ|nr:hypothetical protein PPERSA_06603 [Pseudocohnilembus persalinus]|eukprot:KRX04969.1 hypothetical protein PPERSA_06603 [Pseudocohnilembus persalinus]